MRLGGGTWGGGALSGDQAGVLPITPRQWSILEQRGRVEQRDGKQDLLIPCAMGQPGQIQWVKWGRPVGGGGLSSALSCSGALTCFYSAALTKRGASAVGQVGSRGAGRVWGPSGPGPATGTGGALMGHVRTSGFLARKSVYKISAKPGDKPSSLLGLIA